MKKAKRLLSVILSASMLLSLLSVGAYAENPSADDGIGSAEVTATDVTDDGIGDAEVSATDVIDEIPSGDRQVISLDGDWSFTDYEGNTSTVQVPHDWQFYTAAAAYNPTLISKTVTYEKVVDVSALAGQEIFLQFGAVNKVATVYVDGEQVGTHTGGYTAFAMDITAQCQGKSEVTVKVENTNATFDTMPVNTDFTHYAGIYRDVNLVGVNPSAYIALEDNGTEGVYLTNSVDLTSGTAALTPSVKVSNMSGAAEQAVVRVELQAADGSYVASGEESVSIAAGETAKEVDLAAITVKNAHLWQGTDDPYLYTAVTTVSVNGEVVDSNTQTIGFRSYEVKDGVFYLNGVEYDLRGVGMHQQNDGSYVSTKEDMEEAIGYVQEMGANALRTCHYPHDQYTYQLCDEAGIVVWAEIPFYLIYLDSDTFRENTIQNLTEMVEQYYNHASIIVWGIENEVYYSSTYARFYNLAPVEEIGNFMQQLAQLTKELDPSRLVGEAEIDNTNYANDTANWTTEDSGIDTVGFNLYNGWYGNVNGATSENKIDRIVSSLQSKVATYEGVFGATSNGHTSYVLTEYGAGACIDQHTDLRASFQWGGTSGAQGFSTSGTYQPEEYQSYVHEGMMMAIYGDETNDVEPAQGLWAAFAWSLFDFSCYRNEGSTTLTNTKGLISADRQTKKDAFYLYKANWNDEDYFVHICSSRYTERRSQTTDIRVYSNCDSVELILNGVSLGQGVKEQDGVFIWKGVQLADTGITNTVKAIGTRDGSTYTDEVNSWVYTFGYNDDDSSYNWSWASSHIYSTHEKGYFSGDENGNFNADSGMTRAEAVTALLAMKGITVDSKDTAAPFKDVSADQWYAPYVAAAYKNGIASGESPDTFAPEADITRAEFVTMLLRVLGTDVDMTVTASGFADADGDWYTPYVAAAAAAGITAGDSDGNFNPNTTITRAEAATMMDAITLE